MHAYQSDPAGVAIFAACPMCTRQARPEHSPRRGAPSRKAQCAAMPIDALSVRECFVGVIEGRVFGKGPGAGTGNRARALPSRGFDPGSGECLEARAGAWGCVCGVLAHGLQSQSKMRVVAELCRKAWCKKRRPRQKTRRAPHMTRRPRHQTRRARHLAHLARHMTRRAGRAAYAAPGASEDAAAASHDTPGAPHDGGPGASYGAPAAS